jgi:hypothetical protein
VCAASLYRHVPLRLVHCWSKDEEDGGPEARPTGAEGGVFRVLLDDGAQGPVLQTTAGG